MAKLKRARSRFLIYPKFQLTLLAVNTAIIGLLLVIVRVQAHRYFEQLKDIGMGSNLDATHPYFQLLAYQEDTFYSMLTAAFCFGFCLSTCLTVLLSHRLAGPIIRLRGHMETIADGHGFNVDLKFRKMDFFTDLPPIVNAAVHRLLQESSKSSRKKAAS